MIDNNFVCFDRVRMADSWKYLEVCCLKFTINGINGKIKISEGKFPFQLSSLLPRKPP